MHKYYRSYAMEHKLQDYHRSGWSVAKKNDTRALSWATTKAGADVKKSELLCLLGAVKPYLYESYLLKAAYVLTLSFVNANFNKQTKRPGKTYFFLQIRQTTYCTKRGFEEKSSLGIRALNLLFYI